MKVSYPKCKSKVGMKCRTKNGNVYNDVHKDRRNASYNIPLRAKQDKPSKQDKINKLIGKLSLAKWYVERTGNYDDAVEGLRLYNEVAKSVK